MFSACKAVHKIDFCWKKEKKNAKIFMLKKYVFLTFFFTSIGMLVLQLIHTNISIFIIPQVFLLILTLKKNIKDPAAFDINIKI